MQELLMKLLELSVGEQIWIIYRSSDKQKPTFSITQEGNLLQ